MEKDANSSSIESFYEKEVSSDPKNVVDFEIRKIHSLHKKSVLNVNCGQFSIS